MDFDSRTTVGRLLICSGELLCPLASFPLPLPAERRDRRAPLTRQGSRYGRAPDDTDSKHDGLASFGTLRFALPKSFETTGWLESFEIAFAALPLSLSCFCSFSRLCSARYRLCCIFVAPHRGIAHHPPAPAFSQPSARSTSDTNGRRRPTPSLC